MLAETEMMMMEYEEFVASKAPVPKPTGLTKIPDLNPMLFDFQRDIVSWALRRGKAALFEDCGLGKGPQALEWARHVPGDVLILAPLAVAQQFIREAEKFGVDGVKYCRSQDSVDSKITITNYEMLDKFDASHFTGVVLDESGILKSYDGKTRQKIIKTFVNTRFKLCCTATPAPNDFMELGNHAEFLGVMSHQEMLSMFFIHDGGETQKWRLKGHGAEEFWKWICSWAVMLRTPSDLGYENEGFDLPPISRHQVTVHAVRPSDGFLFPMEAKTMQERLAARRSSIKERVEACAKIVNETDGPWVVWCNLNEESASLAASINDAVEVKGADSVEHKEKSMIDFTDGKIRVLVTKPTIAGFGMNWQHCNNVAYVGLSDSFEQMYQSTRRCWRFGQEKTVNVYYITSELEGAVVRNVQRKEDDFITMGKKMVEHMSDINSSEIRGASRDKSEYERDVDRGDGWELHLGDCVDVVGEIEDESIGFSVFSPPFASLYTYSNSDRDMGNSKNMDEFLDHFRYLARELYRVTMTGRNCSVHCMDLPTSKAHHGVIGLQDFRGDIIRMFTEAGWVYHSTVVIWKDPVTAMQRTKAIGLLYKQLKKDSCMSRQGIPDYLVTFRKDGENARPVDHTPDDFPLSEWQKIASPIWTDINPSDTLQFRNARENEDERHICPLQLEVIRRAMRMWSKEGDTVLSPFAGIGSEGHVALTMGRRFIGAELKRSYWELAAKHLRAATSPTLFG